MFDLMMVAQFRATKITYLFSNKKGHPLAGTNPATSQRYNSGNVAILAQDIATARTLLPPPHSEVQEAMCALFVGAGMVPTKDNIAKLGLCSFQKTESRL